MFDLVRSLTPKTKVAQPQQFDLIREAAGKKTSFISGTECFRELDYDSYGSWWSKDHEVYYGDELPLKTKSGVPDADAKTFNGFDTYYKSKN